MYIQLSVTIKKAYILSTQRTYVFRIILTIHTYHYANQC